MLSKLLNETSLNSTEFQEIIPNKTINTSESNNISLNLN